MSIIPAAIAFHWRPANELLRKVIFLRIEGVLISTFGRNRKRQQPLATLNHQSTPNKLSRVR